MNRFKNHLRRKLIAGFLAAIPVGITIFILWWVDAKARAIVPVEYPFLGIVVALCFIYLLGVFVTSLLGKYAIGAADHLLAHMPGLRDLYTTWKQIVVTPDEGRGIFSKVVLIPDETQQMRMLGFTSGRPVEGTHDCLCVFVPASPNPTSGRLYFVAQGKCRFLPLSTKEALKFIVSGGNYVPAAVGAALGAPP